MQKRPPTTFAASLTGALLVALLGASTAESAELAAASGVCTTAAQAQAARS